MIVEVKLQPSIKDLSKGKEIIPSSILKEKVKEVEASIDEIHLDEDIVNPNRDSSNITLEEMDTLGELWKKRKKKKS